MRWNIVRALAREMKLPIGDCRLAIGVVTKMDPFKTTSSPLSPIGSRPIPSQWPLISTRLASSILRNVDPPAKNRGAGRV
jgi:hypothetical protein